MKIKYSNCRGKREVKVCENCNGNFETLSIKVRQGGEKFCSVDCYKLKRKEGLLSRNERHILHQKKHKYGLSAIEFTQLINDSGEKCVICETVFTNETKYTSPCIDHCHKSGVIRGILCHKCNSGLGLFKDNITSLERAINYLKNSNSDYSSVG